MSIDENTKVDEKVDNEDENLEIVIADEVKVVLDTDDAPFLEEEPEPEPIASSNASLTNISASIEEENAGWSKKKKIIVFGGGLLLLIIAAVAFGFLFKGSSETSDVTDGIEPQIIVVPDVKEEVIVVDDFFINLEPFLVELKNEESESVFLVFKFSAATKSQRLAQEAENKTLVLRDAVYYYLINKTHNYLMNPANIDTIKNDLSAVLSGYLAGGKIDEVFFERYLTR